jgi:hypothetical protein
MIEQIKFFHSVQEFEKGFRERWNLLPYHDTNKPCYFAGATKPHEIDFINNHKGLKIVWSPGRVRECLLKLDKSCILHRWANIVDYSLLIGKYKIVQATIEIKDYSMFKPVPLGTKVYTYLGRKDMRDLYGGQEIDELKKICRFEIIEGYKGHTMEWVKENYYNNCFIHFKPAVIGGSTSATELALMGRKTLSNDPEKIYTPYASIEQANEIIENEAKNIGLTRLSVLHPDFFDTGYEWLKESFWV